VPVSEGIEHDLASRTNNVDVVTGQCILRPGRSGSFVRGDNPKRKKSLTGIDGANAVATPYEAAIGVLESNHDVVTGHPRERRIALEDYFV
jgi:hypothetical protein